MIDLTKKYTMEELASLYAHTNCWEWPIEILGSAPWYWEEMRAADSWRRRNCKRFTKLFKKLERIVPRELQLSTWQTEILKRKEEEYWDWWNDVEVVFDS